MRALYSRMGKSAILTKPGYVLDSSARFEVTQPNEVDRQKESRSVRSDISTGGFVDGLAVAFAASNRTVGDG